MHPFPTVSDTCDRHIAFPSKCAISPEDSAIRNNEKECLVGIPTVCLGTQLILTSPVVLDLHLMLCKNVYAQRLSRTIAPRVLTAQQALA